MVTQEELEKMSPEEIAELQRQNCIFCKIIKGDVPSQTVLSNEYTQAVLDINPAQKGHVLVMPKEHVPILPLLPPEHFKHLFRDVKRLSKAVKEGAHAQSASIFVANGYAAGQQASHFLLHVMARDEGDTLTSHFTLHEDERHKTTQQGLLEPLKKNLPLMMNNHFKRMGKTPFPAQEETPQPDVLQPTEKQQEQLASFFEMYPQAREVLQQDPQQFKELLERVQPEVKELFTGIDLETLSSQFKKLANEQESDHAVTEPSVVQESFTAADVFRGDNPQQQAKAIVAYFMSKPKAKELFQSDLSAFQKLLEQREDIQPLFEDVDMQKLALVLDQLLSGVQHD
jgi:histidine triad (HIT) family protein